MQRPVGLAERIWGAAVDGPALLEFVVSCAGRIVYKGGPAIAQVSIVSLEEDQTQPGASRYFWGVVEDYKLSLPAPMAGAAARPRAISLKGSFPAPFTAVLKFYPDGVALPRNGVSPEEDFFWLSYREEDWAAIIDVVRNERQVAFFFYPDTGRGYIKSTTEPFNQERG